MEFGYSLDAKMDATSIAIYDLSGKLVYSAAGNTTPGKHSFTWDGKDANGNAVAGTGPFRISVNGTNAESSLAPLPTSVSGKITGVESTDSGVLLSIGDVHIPMGNILSVKETPAPAAS